MYTNLKLFFRLLALKKKLKKNNVVANYSLKPENKDYILIVDDIIPEPDKDSGSRRITEIIKLLLRKGYGVYLMPNYKEYKYKGGYADQFRKLGVIVYEPAVDSNGKLITREEFVKAVVQHTSHVWLHRPHIFAHYYNVVKKFNATVPVIFDMVDFHYLRMKREAELTGDTEASRSAQKYLAQEVDNCKKADKIIVISAKDKEALLEFYKDEAKMEIVGNIHDFEQTSVKGFSFSEREGLLFVGGFSHRPNEDAVMYLHNEIMPQVWAKHPEIKVNIVGSNPTEAVKALHSEKFNVVGYVEDVVPSYAQARLFVAPLRYGAGIKGKIGQSLEHSLPLVTTTIGAEGFDFGVFAEHVVADTPESFAQKIIKLYYDEQLWQNISDDAARVIEPFSLRAAEQSIEKVLK